jgi:phage/plasmid-associated DNA primase
VGDSYFEYLKIPNRYAELTETYHNRQKSTIKDDHGPKIFDHIAKYKAFCNTPDHRNYQRVINNCFNTYHPFTHIPEEGECEKTLDFIKHIFGNDIVELENGHRVPRYELGLDYLTILYTHPQQILPILCLVSRERETGKTTFAKWLKLLFTENMAIVGNNDFENAFNAHWITKLLVCVDETKIDKLNVVEKIKALSTSSHTMMNAKGKDQIEVETFLKFILLSNNEDNFINIDKEEIRFWVLSVPSISGRKVDKLEQHLIEEIPAFLNFLNRRKIITQPYGRA